MKERVEAALEKIRPSLQADGGDVELVEVTTEGGSKSKINRCLCGLSDERDDFTDGYWQSIKGRSS